MGKVCMCFPKCSSIYLKMLFRLRDLKCIIFSNIELDEEVRGPQSHVSRTVIEENGEELHIFRRNTPFGTATEHGTMFIGFSHDQCRLARMLARMAGAEDGIRDALTRYTTAVSGSYYFVPSVESLRSFAVEGMSHPEFLWSMFSLFSMTEPEVSAHWERKEPQELGGSRPRDD